MDGWWIAVGTDGRHRSSHLRQYFPTNTVYGIVTDNNAVMGAAKYTSESFKYFGGFEYIWQNNPSHPLGVGASDQGGYFMSGVEDNNLDTEKI